MKWDPTGERVVVSFKSHKTEPTIEEDISYEDSGLLCVFSSKITSSNIVLAPLGFIRGDLDETPITFEFAKHFKLGALLTIVSNQIIKFRWVNRVQNKLDLTQIVCHIMHSYFRHGRVEEYNIYRCSFQQPRQCQLEQA